MAGKQLKSRRARPSIRKLSTRSVRAKSRAVRALTAMRHGASLAEAAKDLRVSQRTIRKYVGSALRQDRVGGRIRVVRADRFTRQLQLPGQVQVTAKGSKQASELAKYVNARATALRTGDASSLRLFEGKRIGGHELVTDLRVITAEAEQGESFDQLYASLVG